MAVWIRRRARSASQLDDSIKELLSIEGANGAAIVDVSSGMALASGGNPGFDLNVAAAGNSDVVRAKLRTMQEIDIAAEIEDIMITLSNQYHLIRALNSRDTSGLLVCLVLDRTSANLALAGHKLNAVSGRIAI